MLTKQVTLQEQEAKLLLRDRASAAH